MKENWKELGFKDRAQYTTAMVLIASGILLAFVSFFLIHTITSGVLIYIAQAFTAGGAIFKFFIIVICKDDMAADMKRMILFHHKLKDPSRAKELNEVKK